MKRQHQLVGRDARGLQVADLFLDLANGVVDERMGAMEVGDDL
jgi:hypothetical protein